MPKVVLANPGVKDSVTRPVIIEIARTLSDWMGLEYEARAIQFPGEETNAMAQPGSTISNDPEFNKMNTSNQFAISVEEDYDEDKGLAMAVLQEDNPHIFYDADTNVYIKPAYTQTTLKLTMGNRFVDRTAAKRWRDEMRTRVAMNWQARVHNASYSYLIPLEMITILQEIHRMREAVAPYGETFDQYINRYISTKARQVANQSGSYTQWAVAETQARILGYFDFSLTPEKGEVEDNSSAWTVTFTYTLQYAKPIATVMEYPLVIHNQLMDKKYRPTAPPERIEDKLNNYSISSRALASFENSRASENNGVDGVAMPSYDEFMPAKNTVYPDTVRLFTSLIGINTNDPTNLMNLKELSKYSLDPDIVGFLYGEAPYLTKLKFSPFNVCVYKGFYPMFDDEYFVDDQLNVKLVNPPDLRKVYHVRFSIYERPKLLTEEAKQRMRNNCKATMKIFQFLLPDMVDRGISTYCDPNNYVSRDTFNTISEEIEKNHDIKFNGQRYGFNTVMQLTVTAHRR